MIGANEDERRLLRGLLLLRHRPIALEAPTLGAVAASSAAAPARVLVYVAPPSDDRWSEELRGTLAARPDLSALVLLPLDGEAVRSTASRAGARGILPRPFTSRQFFDAVDRLSADRPGPPPASSLTDSARPARRR